MAEKTALSVKERDALLETLKVRFEKHTKRHDGLAWDEVQARLEAHPDKLWSLNEMERTGGEPDVVGRDSKTGELIFYDCAPESPAERRSICYDQKALDARKANKPADSAMNMAESMGITLVTEEEYHALQKLGPFDTKTSSWIQTPPEIRERGGALFGDCRYGRVFIYHNGADSYYSARGFRGVLRV